MKIFVAGATGAIGLPLVRVLCALHHEVTGMTRAGTGADRLRELGAGVSLADAFHPQSVRDAIEAVSPDVVIDQLTWLPANPADIIKSMPKRYAPTSTLTRIHSSCLAMLKELGAFSFIGKTLNVYFSPAVSTTTASVVSSRKVKVSRKYNSTTVLE